MDQNTNPVQPVAKTLPDLNMQPQVEKISPVITPMSNTSTPLKPKMSDGKNLGQMMKWIVVIVVGLALLFLIGSTIFFFMDDGGKVSNVRVTNVTANGATISWTTEEEVKGRVLWDSDNSFMPFIFQSIGNTVNKDDRDLEQIDSGEYVVESTGEGSRITHHVTIRNLTPTTKYYFKVGSDYRYFEGDLTSFTTKKVLEDIQTPDPMYGKVMEPINGEIVKDGIVYYQVFNKELATEFTSWYSVTVNDEGAYSGDLGYLTNDAGEYYKLDTKDVVSVEVISSLGGMNDGFPLEEYQPMPGLPIEKDYKPASSASKLMTIAGVEIIKPVNAECSGSGGENNGSRYNCGGRSESSCNYVGGLSGVSCRWDSQGDNDSGGGGGSPEQPAPTPVPQGDRSNDGSSDDCTGKFCGIGGSCTTGPSARDGGWGCNCSNGPSSGLGTPEKNFCSRYVDAPPNVIREEENTIESEGGSPVDGLSPGSSCNPNSASDPCSGGDYCLNCSNQDVGHRCGGSSSGYTCNDIAARVKSSPTVVITPPSRITRENLDPGDVTEDNSAVVQESWGSRLDGLLNARCSDEACPVEVRCSNGQTISRTGMSVPADGQSATCRYNNGATLTRRLNGTSCTGESARSLCSHTGEAIVDLIQNLFVPINSILPTNAPTETPTSTPSVTQNLRDCAEVRAAMLELVDESDIHCGTSENIPSNCTEDGVEKYCTSGEDTTLIAQVLGANTTNTQTVQPGVYQINGTGIDSIELTITDDNVQVIFFNDKNGDGIKQETEDIVEQSSLNISLNKTDEVVNYDLNNGWNLLGFEIVSDKWDKASELIADFNLDGVTVTHIATYTEGKWLMYSARVDSNGEVQTFGDDFTILPGKGYFFKSLSAGTVNLTGRSFSAAVPLNMANGWNLISVQSPTAYNSQEFLNKCVSGGVQCDSVARFDSGLYEIVVTKDGTLFGNNFNLIKKSGYFVRVVGGGGKQIIP